MARSFIKQDTQISNSYVYDDTLAAGVTLETGATSLEADLNGLRSQVQRIIGETNWYDALAGRSISTLDTDLTDLEGKKVLCRSQILTDVAVPATQNYVVLSVAGSEAPTQVAAVALTQDGAVVAQSALNGAGFAANELIEIAGASAIQPKNRVVVREATTGDPILSGGKQVYGLLQYESTGADGAAFDDVSAGARVKISFVRENASADDLEAVPVADIENLSVNYAYTFRSNLDAIPEDCFLPFSGFVDQTASVDVTLDNAIDNQSGAATLTQNIDVQIADNFSWAFTDPSGAVDILRVDALAAGDEVEVNGALDVNGDATVSGGITADDDGTPIQIGVNAGVIESGAGNDLTVLGAQELFLDDGNQTGSTWAQTGGIKLSETTAEWDAFESAFGEVSLLAAITAANGAAARVRGQAIVQANVAADADVSQTAGNLDVNLHDYSGVTFLTDVDVYLNGQLLRNGANAAANEDVYPGTTPADGELRFEFALKGTGANPDVITMIVNGT